MFDKHASVMYIRIQRTGSVHVGLADARPQEFLGGKLMAQATVKIVGVTGTATIEVADGYTARDVLVAAAEQFGLPTPDDTVARLSAVADGQTVGLDDSLPSATGQVTGAPKVRLG